jgi:hypothetical protein
MIAHTVPRLQWLLAMGADQMTLGKTKVWAVKEVQEGRECWKGQDLPRQPPQPPQPPQPQMILRDGGTQACILADGTGKREVENHEALKLGMLLSSTLHRIRFQAR